MKESIGLMLDVNLVPTQSCLTCAGGTTDNQILKRRQVLSLQITGSTFLMPREGIKDKDKDFLSIICCYLSQ